ncbi:MAG: hypothetical protein Q7R49_01980, partial [Candidatus Daviesbacteria bacterium]|nr:hypothetical protein [Candidatus Daviesbacteria bacterium]
NEDVLNLPNLSSNSQFNSQGTYDQINQIFNDQDKQQKTILEAREILGDSAKELSDEQVYDLVNEIQYLVDSWLEEYERKVFDGKSLNELLNLEP